MGPESALNQLLEAEEHWVAGGRSIGGTPDWNRYAAAASTAIMLLKDGGEAVARFAPMLGIAVDLYEVMKQHDALARQNAQKELQDERVFEVTRSQLQNASERVDRIVQQLMSSAPTSELELTYRVKLMDLAMATNDTIRTSLVAFIERS